MKTRAVGTGERFTTALEEIGAFFLGTSPVQMTAADVARRLDELGVDYAIAGALCLAAHGLVRATEDVDILITREGLKRFKERWLGLGYVDLRPGGKAIRDTATGVKVDFLISGDYPGDGEPKPVSFPEPNTASMEAATFRVLSLRHLLELKLASGMTAAHRLQDLADVQRLIAKVGLPREMGGSLDPYVRAKFFELWDSAQHPEEDY